MHSSCFLVAGSPEASWSLSPVAVEQRSCLMFSLFPDCLLHICHPGNCPSWHSPCPLLPTHLVTAWSVIMETWPLIGHSVRLLIGQVDDHLDHLVADESCRTSHITHYTLQWPQLCTARIWSDPTFLKFQEYKSCGFKCCYISTHWRTTLASVFYDQHFAR